MTIQQYNDIFKNPVTKSMSITSSGGITITNTNICLEEMSLEESLCSDGNLTIGACESACFKIRIADMNHNFEGELLTVNQIIPIDQNTDETIPYGVFKVISDKATNDRKWRDLTCYDAMYDILNADVSEWFNSLTFPMTVKNLRDSFFTYLGVTQVTTTLVNDNFQTQGGFSVSGVLSGKDIITAICELNGVFGHISREGQFEYISLPSADSLTLDWYMDGTGAYEDYLVQKITGIVARSSESDVGTSVGTDTNVYVIQDNPLIYGTEGTSILITALTNVLNNVNDIMYRPFNVSTYGNPMLPLGTNLTIETRNQTINSFVMSRLLTGIQSLKDSYSAVGEKNRPSEVNSLRSEVNRTKGKIHELVVTTDELRSTISSIEEIAEEASEDASDAKQTAEGVATDLSTNYFTKSETTSEISQSATSILSTVSQTYTPKSSAIKTDTLHYLATSQSSGVTKSTPGWTTTIQSVTSTDKYLWTYHTYTYADDHTSDTTPIITGVYGDQGQQGGAGPQGPQGPTGTGISTVTPLYYAGTSTKPSKPTSVVTSTSTSGGQWTKSIPSLSSTYSYLYTCDQVYYTNSTYKWTDVVSDINSTTSYSEINQLKDKIVLKVDNSGKIVQVALSANASTGSEFKVKADNIDFIANGVMNLTANNLGISSTNFSINPTNGNVTINGSVTCNDGKITITNSADSATGIIKAGNASIATYIYRYVASTGTIESYGTANIRQSIIIDSTDYLQINNDTNINGHLTVGGNINANGYDLSAKSAIIQNQVITTELWSIDSIKSDSYKLHGRYNDTDYENTFLSANQYQTNIGWSIYDYNGNVIMRNDPMLSSALSFTAPVEFTRSSDALSIATSAGTITKTELGYLSGATSNIQTQLDSKISAANGAISTVVSSNLTASRALISNANGKIAVSSITSTKLGYLTDVTSNIQSQLNGKQASITGAATTITSSNLTTSRALISNSSGKVAVSSVTSTELGYLSGVTSNIQTQLDSKISSANGAISTVVNSNLTTSRALISNTSGKIAVSTTTSTELGYLSGVTSNVQTQLNGKQSTISGGATTITSSNLTTNRALVSNSSGKVAVSTTTSTELSYVHGVTSNIQDQIDDLKCRRYSTTEQLTRDVWLDGKPIYQKTITKSNLQVGSSTLVTIAHNITNLGNMVDLEIQMTTNESSYIGGVVAGWVGSAWCTSTNLLVTVNANWNATNYREWHFTIRYTKTS
jgi:hypothetical protein